KIKRQHRQIRRQHTIEPPAIEAPESRSLTLQIRPQKLRANQVPAQHKEQVDAHPPEPRYTLPRLRECSPCMKRDDRENRETPQRVQAMHSRRRIIQARPPALLLTTNHCP